MHYSHSPHVPAHLQEDELRTLEDASNKATIKALVDAEYSRNRMRVVEIWNLVHVVNRSELQVDRYDE